MSAVLTSANVIGKMWKLASLFLLFLVLASEAQNDVKGFNIPPDVPLVIPEKSFSYKTSDVNPRPIVKPIRRRKHIRRHHRRIYRRNITIKRDNPKVFLRLDSVAKPIETIVTKMSDGLLRGSDRFAVKMISNGTREHHFNIDVAK
ncbi:hypothetical protein COOONC_22700 [Cooperia oncophora]